MAPVPQADALVLIVRLAVTADVPETVAFDIAKHKSADDGALETVQAIVPVYPFWGVIVTVDVPVLPAAMVASVAARVKLLEADEPPLHAASKLLKFTEPRPEAMS